MKVGDLVVVCQDEEALENEYFRRWEGLACQVSRCPAPGDRWVSVVPLQKAPFGGTCAFYWPAEDLKPAYKVVSFQKLCGADGVGICDTWKAILQRFTTLDEVVAWINEDPNDYVWDGTHGTRRAFGPDYALERLSNSLEFQWPFDRYENKYLPVGAEYVAKVKAFLEAKSDQLGVTEYRRCDAK